MNVMINLEGRVAFVTGASRGLVGRFRCNWLIPERLSLCVPAKTML